MIVVMNTIMENVSIFLQQMESIMVGRKVIDSIKPLLEMKLTSYHGN